MRNCQLMDKMIDGLVRTPLTRFGRLTRFVVACIFHFAWSEVYINHLNSALARMKAV